MSEQDAFSSYDDFSPGIDTDLTADPALDPTADVLAPAPVPGDTHEAPSVADEMSYWHQQEAPDTCAVVSQEFLIDRFTGVDHTEAELVEVAEANQWYQPGAGTTEDDVGKLLEHYGIPVERSHGGSLADVESALDSGAGVLVSVDSDEIWNAGAEDYELADAMGIPGAGADHVVQVIGVDRSDPADPRVVLNDPGSPDGAGLSVPEGDFVNAWQDAGRFTVVAGGDGHG
jgi:hypothetical protein